MSELVLNVKYMLLLSFLIAAKFYNLGHIQGIKEIILITCTTFRSAFQKSKQKFNTKFVIRHSVQMT